jgi:glucan biosynthesis protein C
MTQPVDERRYYGLDALRGGMMMLGIVLHAAWLYMADPPPALPVPTDRNNSYAFDLMFAFIHDFRMPLFMVLAGFFAALLVEKRGVWGTLKNRAARVALPLIAAAFTILPLTLLLLLDFWIGALLGWYDFIPRIEGLQALGERMVRKGMPRGEIPLAHLWFLYYLCYFYLLIPACAWVVGRTARLDDKLRGLLASPWLMPLLGLFTALTLWPLRGGQAHEGFGVLKPQLPGLVYYGSFFVLGYFFHRFRDSIGAPVRPVWRWGAAGVALFAVAQYASGLDNAVRGASFERHLAAVIANGLCTWALIYFFVGATLRWFDRDAPWIVYASQSAYWVFLIHMPLVCLAGWYLLRFDLPSGVKFLLVCAFAAAGSFLSFHYWVQKSWLSSFLHGRRFDLPWPWGEARSRKDPAAALS